MELYRSFHKATRLLYKNNKINMNEDIEWQENEELKEEEEMKEEAIRCDVEGDINNLRRIALKQCDIHEIELPEPNNVIFFGKYPDDTEEIIRISKDGFYYKGERVDDIHNVYERFNDWLTNNN